MSAGILLPAQNTIAPAGVVPKPSREFPLPETAKHMKNVPATRRELDARVAAVAPEGADANALREARLAPR